MFSQFKKKKKKKHTGDRGQALCLLQAAHGVHLCRGIASGDGGKGCLRNGCLQWLVTSIVGGVFSS